MCEHKWERIERPYQYQIDTVEGVSFEDSKIWIICKKCMTVNSCVIRKLIQCIPLRFLQAGIGT